MDVEQVDAVKKALKRMKSSNRPFYYRLVAKGPDGKPLLLLQRRESGLDQAARAARREALDKRLAAGRVVRDGAIFHFGLEEGTLPRKQAERAIVRELSRDKKLKTYRALLQSADVLEGDDWAPYKPERDTGDSRVDPHGLEGDSLQIDSHAETRRRGRKDSGKSRKKGSHYSRFLEELDTWHRRFGAGHAFTRGCYDRALEQLDAIERHADDWLDSHRKRLIEGSKRRSRRAQVKRVKEQVASARVKLEAFSAVGRSMSRWEKRIGDPVAPKLLPVARDELWLLRKAVNDLEALTGVSSGRGSTAEAFAQGAEKAIKVAEAEVRGRLEKALTGWSEAYGDGPTQGDAANLGTRLEPLIQSVAEVEAAFPKRTPKQLLEAKRAIELAKALRTAPQDERLDAVREATNAVRRIWPKGLTDVRDMSQARGLVDRLEAALRSARQAKLAHEDVEEGRRVFELMQRSMRNVRARGVDEALSEDDEKHRAAAEEARRRQATKRGRDRHRRWAKKADEALAADRYHLDQKKKLATGGFGAVYALAQDKKTDPKLVAKLFKDPEELMREVAMYEAIGAHPNIARCLGNKKVQAGGKKRDFLVMEQVEGPTVGDALKSGRAAVKDGAMSHEMYWGAVQHIMRGTLRGLVHMQRQGLGHNDIKPPNIMLDPSTGEPLLLDMGGVREVGAFGSAYTPGYARDKKAAGVGRKLQPEEKATGERRDVHAVGASARHAVGDDYKDFQWSYVLDTPAKGLFEGKAEPEAPAAKGASPYRAHTAYVDFIKATTKKRREDRPSLEEALALPFLADPILSEADAKKAVKALAKLG